MAAHGPLSALAGLLLLGLVGPAPAQDGTGAPFLFSDDEQIATPMSQYVPSLKSSTQLKDDEWFSTPLTRLDYVLMKIDSQSDEVTELAREIVADSFEKGIVPLSVKFKPGYLEEKGRVYLGVTVEANGKPKKPLKEICKDALYSLESSFPASDVLFSMWHTNALGILVHGATRDYDVFAKQLRQNAILAAAVSTFYKVGDQPKSFTVVCRHGGDEDVTEFFKSSTK